MWVSLLALVVSALSFFAAAWAAWVSHRTLNHAQRVHFEDRRISFERERSELLEIITTSRSLLDQTRIKIGTLKANFDASPQPVQRLMQSYTNLFTEYYPRIAAGVRQAEMLWNEVADWHRDTEIEGLVRHQARFRALLHEDQVAHDQGVFMVEIFEAKFAEATKTFAQAARGTN